MTSSSFSTLVASTTMSRTTRRWSASSTSIDEIEAPWSLITFATSAASPGRPDSSSSRMMTLNCALGVTATRSSA